MSYKNSYLENQNMQKAQKSRQIQLIQTQYTKFCSQQMISHGIRTSKYTTTIQIPAEKLQTKAKFIQIAKNPQVQEQVITVPNQCYHFSKQRRQMNIQTKMFIEELEQAYNEDVKQLEGRIKDTRTQHQIQKLKLQNLLQIQRREAEIYRRRAQQIQVQIGRSNQTNISKIHDLQGQVKNKDSLLSSKNSQIERFESQIRNLIKQNNEKSSLLASKFRQFETQNVRRHSQQNSLLTSRIQALRRQKQDFNRQIDTLRQSNQQTLSKAQRLYKQNANLMQDNNQLGKLTEFKSKQIQAYAKNIKQLQIQKLNLHETNDHLHQKIQLQHIQIERLLEQMRQQRQHIEITNIASSNEDKQIQILTHRIVQYEQNYDKRQGQLLEGKTQYLLKLKQIDQQRQISKKLQAQLDKANQQIKNLSQEILTLNNRQQQLKNQITKRIFEYNQLLTKPPQHYQVRIQKTIDKKQYIQELQNKIIELQKTIQHLKGDNQACSEEIKKKVFAEQESRKREENLFRSTQELKEYILKKQNSIGWAVERQIMKDVQISKDQSSEKSREYKVFVKNSINNKSCSCHSQEQFSGINKPEGINFSLQSKLQKILQHKHISSGLQKCNNDQQ